LSNLPEGYDSNVTVKVKGAHSINVFPCQSLIVTAKSSTLKNSFVKGNPFSPKAMLFVKQAIE
jgi:hypothetical protein